MTDEAGPLQYLIRRAWLIGLCCLLAAGAALALSVRQEKEYEATAEVLNEPARSGGVSPWRVGSYNIELVARDMVARRVADQLGGDLTTADVRNNVVVDGDPDFGWISMTASDPDPGFAIELANAYAGQALRVLPAGNAQIAERARVAESPSSQSVIRSTAVGGALGLMLGAALALLLGRFDRRLRSAEELGEASGLPVLASVPESSSLASFLQGKRSNERSPAPLPFAEAEAFRMLGTRLRYLDSGRELRSVVVTSALPREGKTTVAANLAISQAGTGFRVLLIEADLRRPVLDAVEGVHPRPGLAEVLSGQCAPAEAVQRLTADASGEATRHLDLIVGGTVPPNPVELMESRRMATLLDELSDRYDLVVIDTPPPTVLADAIPLLKLADQVLVVAQMGKITQDGLTRLREELRRLDARVVGVVANRAPKGREARYGEHYQSERALARVRLGQDTGGQPGREGSGTQEVSTASPPVRRGGEPAGSA